MSVTYRPTDRWTDENASKNVSSASEWVAQARKLRPHIPSLSSYWFIRSCVNQNEAMLLSCFRTSSYWKTSMWKRFLVVLCWITSFSSMIRIISNSKCFARAKAFLRSFLRVVFPKYRKKIKIEGTLGISWISKPGSMKFLHDAQKEHQRWLIEFGLYWLNLLGEMDP